MSHIKYKLTPKFLKLLIHQNDPLWPLSLLHRFSAFFPLKTGDSSARLSCKNCQRWAALMGCLALTFQSSCIPCQFNGIQVCWLCQPRHQLKDVLFLFAFNVLLVELTSMLWVIILHEYKSLSHKPNSKWDCVILQYAVTASLI